MAAAPNEHSRPDIDAARHGSDGLNGSVRQATSDQAPGEETVQVNDQYAGGGPSPQLDSEHDQHQTGG